jgi:hypothetical protein
VKRFSLPLFPSFVESFAGPFAGWLLISKIDKGFDKDRDKGGQEEFRQDDSVLELATGSRQAAWR